jgi:hypothetical protein
MQWLQRDAITAAVAARHRLRPLQRPLWAWVIWGRTICVFVLSIFIFVRRVEKFLTGYQINLVFIYLGFIAPIFV